MAAVLIIDNYPLTRQGISLILEQEPDLTVCGQAGDAESALKALERLDPDLAIVELAVPGMIGLDLIKHMRARKPAMRLLVLSRYDELTYAALALKAGVSGYVMKQAEIDVFLKAVRCVLAGEVYVSDAVNRQLLQQLTTDPEAQALLPSEVLSSREWEIFKLIGHGLTTREIATRLGLSRKTVDTHRSRMKRKLHLSSTSEMMRLSMWWVEHESV